MSAHGFKRRWLVFEVVFQVMWIGTMAPLFGNLGGSRCANASTNIDCNDIGVPYHEVTRPVGPQHARLCTVDDIEFYSLKVIQHLCNVTCRPVTLWPSDRYDPRWAGREAWVTCCDGRTREVPADAARGSTPLMTLLPRHYHASIVKRYL
jgi:hypothetical protein